MNPTEMPLTPFGQHLKAALDRHVLACVNELDTWESKDWKESSIRVHMLEFYGEMRGWEKSKQDKILAK